MDTLKTWDEVYAIISPFSDFPDIRYEKCKAVCELASEVREGVIVELGTYIGLTAITMALSSDAHVHAIDDYMDKAGWAGEPYRKSDKGVFECNAAIAGVRITLHQEDALEAAKRWKLPIGLLFWDIGGTRLESDFEAWQSHIIKGGIWATKDIDDCGFGSRKLASKKGWRAYRDYPDGLVCAVKKYG